MLLGEEGGTKNISQFLSARKLEQVELMLFFAATLHTDDNNVTLIENVLLIITFSVPVGRQQNCATHQRSTIQPFSRPSGQPSIEPSLVPTIQPSTHPTLDPTGQPSTQPSYQSSILPSKIRGCLYHQMVNASP